MEFHGGCQCGRIRFQAKGPRDRATVCYCRMCQKASGGPFMAFVRFRVERVAWTSPPEVFESSNMVERGFCKACGTPLTHRYARGPFISITINSLDDPAAIQPELSFATDQKAAWLQSLDSLPDKAMDLTETAGFVSHQVP